MSSDGAGATLVAGLRAHVLADCARAADRYRRIWAITTTTHAEARHQLGFRTRWASTRDGAITTHDLDVQAGREVAAATGLTAYRAEQEVHLARTLCTVLTTTLGILAAGRIDPDRARVLADAVTALPEVDARKVERVILDGLPTQPLDGAGADGVGVVGPWDGCSPRAFAARVTKAVAKVTKDTEKKVRDDVRTRTGITAWVHPENPALTSMTVTGPTEQVLGAHANLVAAARALTRDQLAGRTLGMATVDLLTTALTSCTTTSTNTNATDGAADDSAADDTAARHDTAASEDSAARDDTAASEDSAAYGGSPAASEASAAAGSSAASGVGANSGAGATSGAGGSGGACRCRVRRELGIVLNADTLFGDGPAADDPGQVRGNGAPMPTTAAAARVLAEQAQRLAQTTGAGTCVLLADRDGMLVRLLRVGVPPAGGWTRDELMKATKRALAKAPEARHLTAGYHPTVEIDEHVRARDPVCTFPGCGVPASRCDVDHGVPHPRGPTSVPNLSPRSRRCHRYKTAGLWHVRTRTNTAGLVVAHQWTSHLGTRQDVPVEPLPGYAPGEAYAR